MVDQNVFPITDREFVGQLIPQRFPFVMIDKMLSFSENKVVAGFTISSANIFVLGAIFQEAGIIEHMAQSVALFTGYQFYLKQESAPTGYIGAIKSINILKLPQVGEEIETTVSILQEFMGVTLVEISSQVNNQIIAFGHLKTVLAS